MATTDEVSSAFEHFMLHLFDDELSPVGNSNSFFSSDHLTDTSTSTSESDTLSSQSQTSTNYDSPFLNPEYLNLLSQVNTSLSSQTSSNYVDSPFLNPNPEYLNSSHVNNTTDFFFNSLPDSIMLEQNRTQFFEFETNPQAIDDLATVEPVFVERQVEEEKAVKKEKASESEARHNPLLAKTEPHQLHSLLSIFVAILCIALVLDTTFGMSFAEALMDIVCALCMTFAEGLMGIVFVGVLCKIFVHGIADIILRLPSTFKPTDWLHDLRQWLDGHRVHDLRQRLDGHRAIRRPLHDNRVQFHLQAHRVDESVDGRKIGKLFVSNREIAKGSNGTIVLEGNYEGRDVAVKRLVKAYHDVAHKEIQNLILSDRHPNIVRWYGVESDQDFVYLSLERCACSLSDLIQKSTVSEDQATKFKVPLESMEGTLPEVKLWTQKGYPLPILFKFMRDMVSGLVHLHGLGMVHRDLKPQNVLVIKEGSLCAKLSDMGISKRLVGDVSSLGHHATGYGSSGWQAPEQLLHGRETRAVDMFSLGCVLFYCITRGRHPFGDHLERDINIVKSKADLFLVEHIPEAVDLLSRLLDRDAKLRPKASEVLNHPFFWDSFKRVSFLCHASDWIEQERRGSLISKALECIAPRVLGTNRDQNMVLRKWDGNVEPALLDHSENYRLYKYDSARDLLRFIRNNRSHYLGLPREIQEILGPEPEGYDDYFRSRFPKLLMEVYGVMLKFCREEQVFKRYFEGSVV